MTNNTLNEDNLKEKPTVEERITNLEGWYDELQHTLEHQKKEEKAPEPKPFVDIPFDTWRKIENLWLGNIEGISKVRAYRATSSQTIATDTLTKVQFNAESYDSQGEFDSTTNYRFTATKAGYYAIIASLIWSDNVATKVYELRISKNGAEVAKTWVVGSDGGNTPVTLSDIIYLAAGDYIEIYGFQNTGGNVNVVYSASMSFMTIHKLS